MSGRLQDRQVALLIEDEFSARDVTDTVRILTGDDAHVVLVGPSTKNPYHAHAGTSELAATTAAGAARIRDFDALVIPGGHAPDKLRMRHAVLDLVIAAVAAAKPVAAIDRGPQVLISANVLRGRTVTCWPSIAVDVKNAGGLYVDRPAVRDGCIITARKSDDLPFLLEALTIALIEG